MNTTRTILILALACLMTTACKTPTALPKDNYVMNFNRDEIWVLTAMRQREVNYSAGQEKLTLSLNPEAMNISGSAGCNSYFGTYTYTPTADDRGALTFSHMGSTKMMCPDPVMKLEDQYLPLISKTTSCVITAYKLTLLQGDKIILEFEKQ